MDKKKGVTFSKDGDIIDYMNKYMDKKPLYVTMVAKRLDITYSHVVKVMRRLESEGILSMESTGRIQLVKLTEKGKKLGYHIAAIKELNNQ